MNKYIEINGNMDLGAYSPMELPEEVNESLKEKAVSRSQQRFFGMVDAYKKGEMPDASPAIKKAAKGMSKKEVKDFAKTKHKGLPEYVDESKARKLVREALTNLYGGDDFITWADKNPKEVAERLKIKRYNGLVETVEYYLYMHELGIEITNPVQIEQLKDACDKLMVFGEIGQKWAKLGLNILNKEDESTEDNPFESEDIYTMDDWNRDRELRIKEGQLVDPKVYWALLGSVPPVSNGEIFQPGEAYSHDRNTGEPLYQTFKRESGDYYRYIGLKPVYSRRAVSESINNVTETWIGQNVAYGQDENGFYVFTKPNLGVKYFNSIEEAERYARIAAKKFSREDLQKRKEFDYQVSMDESIDTPQKHLVDVMARYIKGEADFEEANKAIMDLANSSNGKTKVNERNNRPFYDYADEYMKNNGKKLPDEALKNAAKKNDERFHQKKKVDGKYKYNSINLDEAVNKEMEDIIRSTVRKMIKSGELPKNYDGQPLEMAEHYNNILEKGINKNLDDFPENGDPNTLCSIVDDEFKKQGGKSDLDGCKNHEESVKKGLSKIVKESYAKEGNYTHFAVSKISNKIVNGWDYSDHDPDELKAYKYDYFIQDLEDNGFDPSKCTILTVNGCKRKGINPYDDTNWGNGEELFENNDHNPYFKEKHDMENPEIENRGNMKMNESLDPKTTNYFEQIKRGERDSLDYNGQIYEVTPQLRKLAKQISEQFGLEAYPYVYQNDVRIFCALLIENNGDDLDYDTDRALEAELGKYGLHCASSFGTKSMTYVKQIVEKNR